MSVSYACLYHKTFSTYKSFLIKLFLRGGLILRTNSFDDFCRSIARDLRNAEQQKYHHLNQHNIIYQYLLFVCLYNAIQSIYAVLNYTKFDIS